MEAHIEDVEKHAIMAALAANEAGRRFRDESQLQAARVARIETIMSQVGRLEKKFQKLQAEVEALKAGKGLDPRVVWDSTEWAGFREDAAFSIAKKVCKDIMEECGGDASLYLDFLDKKRAQVLAERDWEKV